MPPKVKISKEDIVNTALELIKNGEEINARSLAIRLNCSTQPIFSNFKTMEDLKKEVLKKCVEFYNKFVEKEIEKNEYPLYKIMGMAYIEFAKKEKEFFKILYMTKRDSENQEDSELFNSAVSTLKENLKLTNEQATMFHLEMWSFVHGIATMHATGFLELEKDLISKMISDVYNGLKTQYVKKWSFL